MGHAFLSFICHLLTSYLNKYVFIITSDNRHYMYKNGDKP
jgi:hypothetical protein